MFLLNHSMTESFNFYTVEGNCVRINNVEKLAHFRLDTEVHEVLRKKLRVSANQVTEISGTNIISLLEIAKDFVSNYNHTASKLSEDQFFQLSAWRELSSALQGALLMRQMNVSKHFYLFYI